MRFFNRKEKLVKYKLTKQEAITLAFDRLRRQKNMEVLSRIATVQAESRGVSVSDVKESK